MRHVVDLGCAALMVLPPFFYSAASDEGLFACMARLTDRISSYRLRICIYHIIQNAGIGFSPNPLARLAEALPGIASAHRR